MTCKHSIRAHTDTHTSHKYFQQIYVGADTYIASKDGWTPLIAAACNGHLAVVEALLTAGIHIHTYTHIHTYIHKNTHIHHILSYTHTHTHSHTHTHTHTNSHTHIHIHIHTHTLHTRIYSVRKLNTHTRYTLHT